jgi:nitrous oxide reductase accessory protein NosL
MKEALATAIREVTNQLKYDNADWQEPNDNMVVDAQKLYELSYDLEAL